MQQLRSILYVAVRIYVVRVWWYCMNWISFLTMQTEQMDMSAHKKMEMNPISNYHFDFVFAIEMFFFVHEWMLSIDFF